MPIYADLVKNHSVEYIAGGSCQNSMRAFAVRLGDAVCELTRRSQYMVQQKKVCRCALPVCISRAHADARRHRLRR